jgi:hypothetical protein
LSSSLDDAILLILYGKYSFPHALKKPSAKPIPLTFYPHFVGETGFSWFSFQVPGS